MSDDIIPPGEISGVMRKRLDQNLQFLCDGWRAIGRLEGRRMAEWIKCSERMPEQGEWVLFIWWGRFAAGYWKPHPFDEGRVVWVDDEDLWIGGHQVTHWQPLPEPPHY